MQDVKIKGYSAEFTYKDVPFVWLADPSQEIGEPVEGETPNLIPFTYGRAVPITVAPDFSGGDMSIPIADGELVNQLTITQPADLIPENIPEGMYIAGVGPGTFVGEGGSSDGDTLLDYRNVDCTTISARAYQGLDCLRSVMFDDVIDIGDNAFTSCSNLAKADFHKVESMGRGVFYNAKSLVTLIIRTEIMCVLSDPDGLFGVKVGTYADLRGPIALGLGYIYVPAALLESYTEAYSSYHFRAIEDYPEICG